MAGRGPAPKPAQLRQRANRRFGAGTIEAHEGAKVPPIPNPDAREWHPLTVEAWRNAWRSPMASRWLTSDLDALGRVAILWDAFYKTGDGKLMAEIRLQEQRFGLSPLDRCRLQWEVSRGEEKRTNEPRAQPLPRTGTDPRHILMRIER